MKKLFTLSLFLGVMGFLFGQNIEVDSLLKDIYALNANKPEGFEKQIAMGYYHLGDITQAQGQAEQALDLYQRSLDYANDAKDHQIKGTISLKIADYFILLNNLPHAFTEAQNAETAFQAANDSLGIIIAKAYQGLVYYHLEEYVKAWPLLIHGVKAMRKYSGSQH